MVGVPVINGASGAWLNASEVTLTAAGSSGAAFYHHQIFAGGEWGTVESGDSVVVYAQGVTRVRFQAVGVSGTLSRWASAMVRIDRLPPSDPVVTGGTVGWQNLASTVVAAGGSSDGLSGLAGYEYATSIDGGVTWSAATPGSTATVTSEGDTVVRFRAVDYAGNGSGWVSDDVRIDRTAPSDPTVTGGSLAWLSVASVTVAAAGSTDTYSGLAGYEYEISTDGGGSWSAASSGSSFTIGSEGETLVRFRSLDNAGNGSGWVQAMVRIDRLPPSDPVVTGGTVGWQNLASTVVAAGGSTDAGSGVAGYSYQTSTNGGATWSAVKNANSVTISAQGQSLVRFRARDAAGFTSNWAQTSVWLDRTVPKKPTVTGGSRTCGGLRTISAAGSTDTHSGLAGYEYQVSTDNGVTYGAPVSGSSVLFSTPGTYVVQFRSVDNVGLTSAWAPASTGAADTACVL